MINKAGKNIESLSFSIIQSELGANSFSQEELAIVTRVIHTTGDFEFADNLRFSTDAIERGKLLRSGCPIVTDVKMVSAGISTRFMADKNERVRCLIDDPRVIQFANDHEITRSEASMRLQKDILPKAVVAIGNAPTALLELLRLAREEAVIPGLIIGIPVGFVNAAESKDTLANSQLPFITSLGRKGGSPIAAAIINALNALP